jgi:hypothetical protein
MAQITVAYGEYSGYLINEVSDEFLGLLSQRYPLKSAPYGASDGESLLITVAVHEELARRASGGRQSTHIPTVPELAAEVIMRGFRQLSKIHHPDQGGENEAQRRLIEARDCLNRVCENISGDPPTDVVWIPEPPQQAKRTPRPAFVGGITDDDVPF